MNRFQKYLIEEFAEDYQEGHLTRREALKLIASITGSFLLANSILAACVPSELTGIATSAAPRSLQANLPTSTAAISPTAAVAPSDTPAGELATSQPTSSADTPSYGTVSPEDPAVVASDIQFPGEGATLLGYLAQPSHGQNAPVVFVCHENRGLTEHIKDVTRRLAKAGYVALAVDLLSRQGGSPALSSDQVPGALASMPPEQFAQDFLSGWRYLGDQPAADASRVGMVGFCFGGGVTWLVATRMPELRAAVPFYGPHPPVDEVPNIQAAVLAIYAERDQRINQGIPAIEEAMRQHNKIYEKVIYPDADHAFHNDTGSRYNPEAARDAWSRTLDWFARYV